LVTTALASYAVGIDRQNPAVIRITDQNHHTLQSKNG